MATQRQIEANRLNALKSTGPRTPEGKAISRFNALDHGLRAKTLVLPHESAEEFTQLCQSLEKAAGAKTEIERIIIQDAAEAQWRKHRGAIAERRCYDEVAIEIGMAKGRKQGVGENGEIVLSGEEIICAAHSDKRFNNISAHISRNQRAFSRLLNDLIRLRKTPLLSDPAEIPDVAAEPAPEPAVEPTAAEHVVAAAAGAAASSAADMSGELVGDTPGIGSVRSIFPEQHIQPSATPSEGRLRATCKKSGAANLGGVPQNRR